MDTQFYCKNKGRRLAVAYPKDAAGNPVDPPLLNGIDYLEVASNDQLTLNVYFFHNLPGQTEPVPDRTPLTKENVFVAGGQRIKNIIVNEVKVTDNLLEVTVNKRGDFSTYRLMIVSSATNMSPPDGFDARLSTVDFSFKAACPGEFDCRQATECPPEKLKEPGINYLAKDYSSFRRLMFDRLSVVMPDWRERNPADIQVALVELLAYVGDHLSYYQDAVATEAYPGTARKRTSVRRHARLLDYYVHNGCNARAWVNIEVCRGGGADGINLPSGTPLLTGGAAQSVEIRSENYESALNEQPAVFETMHDIELHWEHNRISFYTWCDSECCLPRGSTRATLLNENDLKLKRGDVLVFREILSPSTGEEADADPVRRHAVRLKNVITKDKNDVPVTDELNGTPVAEIEWYEEDALPFPLCLTAIIKNGDKEEIKDISAAFGNTVLADHGRRLIENPDPASVPEKGRYRPHLQKKGLTFAVPYDKDAREKPAGRTLVQDPQKVLPWIKLSGGDAVWNVRCDLLNSDRFMKEYVVEMEDDGKACLRFGDDVMGKKPAEGLKFTADYRIGNGSSGNLGAQTIKRIVWDAGGIDRVTNWLPAAGGTDAETMKEVRQFAPQAFRVQQRAVTEEDYAEVARRHQDVQKAAASFRWTGSWYTVFLIIDRKGGLPVTGDFKKEIIRHLERYRIAGYDMEIRDPVYVALDITMAVCVRPGYFRSNVKESLLEIFSRHYLSDGRRGFFHPDKYTFGQAVYLGQIYKKAMEVEGVDSIEVERFRRWGKTPDREIENGFLKPEPVEIIRLDNDPNFPENGKIDFIMKGGL